MSKAAKKIFFIGRVQGVGFRFTAANIAKRNQLTGQVRNLFDGTVEMIAQGHPDDIDDCVNDLKETYGPNIETKIEDISFDPDLSNFKITF